MPHAWLAADGTRELAGAGQLRVNGFRKAARGVRRRHQTLAEAGLSCIAACLAVAAPLAAQSPNEAITTNFGHVIASCMTGGDIGRIP